MHKNEIENLDKNTFENYINLIELSYNNLTSIPGKLFEKNSKLKTIYLGYNQIKLIDSGMFDHLLELKRLILESNECVIKEQLNKNCQNT